MTVKRSKYIFDNGYEQFEHYLYGIRYDDDVFTIVDEYGKDPHLSYNFRDMKGIWGAIEELLYGQGEELTKEEYDKLFDSWIESYNKDNPRYYSPEKDCYYRILEEVQMKDTNSDQFYDAIMYVYDMTDKSKYIMKKEDFYNKFKKA